MDPDDIYGGLDDINLGEQITELKQRNARLSAQLKKREEDVYKLMKEITEILKREENLKNNISELYKTASTELARKNRLVDELRGQLDDLVFRRGPRHQFGKKRTGTTEDCEPSSKRSCVENESSLIIGHSETNILPSAIASNRTNTSNSVDMSKQDDSSATLLRSGEAVKSRHDQSSNHHAERSKFSTRSKSNVRSKSKVGRRSRSPPRRSDSRSPRRRRSRSPRRRPSSRSPPKGRKRSRSPRRQMRDRRLSRYSSERNRPSPNRPQKHRGRYRTSDHSNSKDKDDVIIVKDDRDVIFVKHDRDNSPRIAQTSTTKTPIRRRRITAMRIADCTPDRELVKQKTDVVTVEQGCSKMETSTSNRTEVGKKILPSAKHEADNTGFLCGAQAARNEFYDNYAKAEPEKGSNLFETVQSVEPESSRPDFTKFLDNLIKTNNHEQNKPTKPGFRWPSHLIEIDRVTIQDTSSTPVKFEQYSSGIGSSNKSSEYSECLSSAEIEYSSSGLIATVDQLKTMVVPVVPKFCESPAGSNESDGDFSGRLMIDEQPQEDFLEKAKTVDSLRERFEQDANKPPDNEGDTKFVEELKVSPGNLQPGRRGRRICKRIRISDDDIVESKEEGVKTKENQQPRIGKDSFEEGRKIEEADQIENIQLENVGKEHKSGEEQLQNQSKDRLKELEECTILRELLESNQTGSKIENKTAENKKKGINHGKSQKQPSCKKTKSRAKNIIKIKVSKNVKVEQKISKKAIVKEQQKKQSKSTQKNRRMKLEDNNFKRPGNEAELENKKISNCKISFQPEDVPNATNEGKEEDRKPSEDLQVSSNTSTISKSPNRTRKLEENNSSEIDLTRCQDLTEEENQCPKQPGELEEAEFKVCNQPEEALINPISDEVCEEVRNEQVTAVTETSQEIKIVETEEKSQSRKRSPRLKEVAEDKRNSIEVSKLSNEKECPSKVAETKSEIDQQSTTVKSLEIPKANEKLDSEATEVDKTEVDKTEVMKVENVAENKLEQAEPEAEEPQPLKHFPKKFEVCSKALSKRSKRLVSIAQERVQEDLAEDVANDNPTSESLDAEKSDKTYHTVFEQFVRRKSDTPPKSDSDAEEASKSYAEKVGSERQEKQQKKSVSEMSVFEIEEDVVKLRRDFLLSIIEMDDDESEETTVEEKGAKSTGIKEESLGVKERSFGVGKETVGIGKEALGTEDDILGVKKEASAVENDFATKKEDLRVEGHGVQKKLLGVIKDLRSKKKGLKVENSALGVKKEETSVVENDSGTKEENLRVEKEVLVCKNGLVVETEALGVTNDLRSKKEDHCVQKESVGVQKKLLGVIKDLRSKKKGLSVENDVLGVKKEGSAVENDFGTKSEALRVEREVLGIKKDLAVGTEVVGVKTDLSSKKEGVGVQKELIVVIKDIRSKKKGVSVEKEGLGVKEEAVGVAKKTVGVLQEAAITISNASSSKFEEVNGPTATNESKTDSTAKTANHNVSPKKRITPIKVDNISASKSPNENFDECHRVKSKTDVTLTSQKDVFGTNRLGPCMPDLFGSPNKLQDSEATKRDTNSTNCFKPIKTLSGEQEEALNISKLSSPRQSLVINTSSSGLTKTDDRRSGFEERKDALKTSEFDATDIEDRLKAMDSLESNTTLLDSPAITSTADLQNLLSDTPKDRMIVSRVSCSSGRRRRCVVRISD